MVNGTIGKQMVDMLVESSNNVEMILKFFDMFLKLKDLTSSDAFKEYDLDGKGKEGDPASVLTGLELDYAGIRLCKILDWKGNQGDPAWV